MKIGCDGTYIITGGAGAIAGHIARTFHEAGARLALVDLDKDRLHQRAAGLDALALAADLTRFDDIERILDEATTELGPIDGLIHTTGGFAMAPAAESGPELYDRMLDLNLRTLVNTCRGFLPHFLDRGSGFLAGFSAAPAWQRGGGAGMSVYAAAKAAVAAYLRAVNDELGSKGIRTTVVYPMGVVETPANRQSMPDADPSTWIDPDEIARALLFAATRSHRGQVEEIAVYARGKAADG
jgi:NADP-dependent 3-hydroxy acid dehydrogenase YdfG